MQAQDQKKQLIKNAALKDLAFFIQLVHPQRVLGDCHKELIEWWNRKQKKDYQLVLLPRDHQKSAMIAYRVVWELTKNPALRILYVSSTSGLAVKQLKFIKDILTSPIYRFYWPEMVNAEDTKREKWTETEISIDHPLRKKEAIRDPSIFTAGLNTNIVGMHCDIAVYDDVVVDESAYDETSRNKLRDQVSYLSSIAGTDSQVWAVGTRYHPLDLYADFQAQHVEIYDELGNLVSSDPLWEVYERAVETKGDGSGTYLWPRTQRKDGKWFGFNQNILARKKAQYADPNKFRAQYYNDPNDVSEAPIKKEFFQYYDPRHLSRNGGKWYFKSERLNVFAAIDFAYSTSRTADWTAIVVIGVDRKNNYYVLDVERFKTRQISEYYDKLFHLFTKWDFRKIRAEVTAAQSVIVEDLKQNYIKTNGLALVVEEHRPTSKKEERILAVLQPRYSNRQIWHSDSSGITKVLEEELTLNNPPHDDVKDALAAAIEIAVAPSFMGMGKPTTENYTKMNYNTRFGGLG